MIHIIVYGKLNEYFESKIEIDVSNEISIQNIISLLIDKNKSSNKLLQVCTFSVDDEFQNKNYILKENDELHIYPPVSGG